MDSLGLAATGVDSVGTDSFGVDPVGVVAIAPASGVSASCGGRFSLLESESGCSLAVSIESPTDGVLPEHRHPRLQIEISANKWHFLGILLKNVVSQ